MKKKIDLFIFIKIYIYIIIIMSFIKNLKNINNILSFEITNDNDEFKISLANAIRRCLLSEIYTYAMDRTVIKIISNTSVVDNELLKNRLMLIPIKSDLNIDYNNIEISCNIVNNDDIINSVYTKNLIVKDINTNEQINNLFPYDNILITKLKPHQVLKFYSKLLYNNALNGGAAYCCTSCCIYTFKIDDNKVKEFTKDMTDVEKKSFEYLEKKRLYQTNNKNEPKTFVFKIETIGQYTSKDLFKKSLDCVVKKLLNFNNNMDNENLIEIKKYDGNIDAFDINVKNENDTLGNLITQYLADENLFFSGYMVSHPLRSEVTIRISITDNNNINYIKKIINNVVLKIINILKKSTL